MGVARGHVAAMRSNVKASPIVANAPANFLWQEMPSLGACFGLYIMVFIASPITVLLALKRVLERYLLLGKGESPLRVQKLR